MIPPTPAPPAQSVLLTSELSSETSEPSYFRKAINEVYRILPRDVCQDGSLPRPRAVRPIGSLGMLELNEEGEDFVVLPHSVCVGKTLDFLEDQTKESRSLRGFQTSASDVKKLTGFGTYKAHSRFWPSEAPPLDACATDTDIKEPQTISVKGEVFKKWESRLRGLADCLSYMELFNAANFLHTQSRTQMPDVPSVLLLRAQARASEQAIAGAVSLAADMLQVRRDATVEMSKHLTSSGRRALRATPLRADTLFGGQITAVLESDRQEYERRAIFKTATAPTQYSRARGSQSVKADPTPKGKGSSFKKRKKTPEKREYAGYNAKRSYQPYQKPDTTQHRGRGLGRGRSRGSSRPPRGRGAAQ